MKLFLVLFFLLISPAFGDTDFQGRFRYQLNRGDLAASEATLERWSAVCPDEVELLAAYGSYYRLKADRGKGASLAKLSPRDEITLDRPKSEYWPEPGDSRNRFDRKQLMEGAKVLKKAVALFPRRIDLRLELALFYQGLGDFESQYLVLSETLQYLDKNRKISKWVNNEDLPDRPSRFIPVIMQGFENYYFDQQGMDSDEKGFRLAKLTMTYFPHDPAAYNSMAAYYYYINDWEHALKYLLLANQKNPEDSLVLNNIGKTLLRFDRKMDAKAYFRKVLDLNNDRENAEFAKKQLEILEGEPITSTP